MNDDKFYVVSGWDHPLLVFRETYAYGKRYRCLWNPVDYQFTLSSDLPDGIDLVKQEINKEDASFLAKKEVFRWHASAKYRTYGDGISWKRWIDEKCVCFVEEVIKRGAPLFEVPDYYCELYTGCVPNAECVGVCRVRKVYGKFEYYFWNPDDSDYTKQYEFGRTICDRYYSCDIKLAGIYISTLDKRVISFEYADSLGRSMVVNYQYNIKRNVEMTWFEWITWGYYLTRNKAALLCRFEGRLMPLRDRPEDVEVLEERAKSGSIIDLDKLAERYEIPTKAQSHRKAVEITIKVLTGGNGFVRNQQRADILTPMEKVAWANCMKRVELLYIRRRKYRISDLFRDAELCSWLGAKYPIRSEESDSYEPMPRLSDYYDDMAELELNTRGDGFD